MYITDEKVFFTPELQREIKEKFYYVNEDCWGRKRQFFENSGGSLRLIEAVNKKCEYEKIPDCPERVHDISMDLKEVKARGMQEKLPKKNPKKLLPLCCQ